MPLAARSRGSAPHPPGPRPGRAARPGRGCPGGAGSDAATCPPRVRGKASPRICSNGVDVLPVSLSSSSSQRLLRLRPAARNRPRAPGTSSAWSVASAPHRMTVQPRWRAISIMREGRLAHAQQAHLGEVVEIVLVQTAKRGWCLLQGDRPFLLGSGQHGVEESHRVALAGAAGWRRRASPAAGRAASPPTAWGRSAGNRTARAGSRSSHRRARPKNQLGREVRAHQSFETQGRQPLGEGFDRAPLVVVKVAFAPVRPKIALGVTGALAVEASQLAAHFPAFEPPTRPRAQRPFGGLLEAQRGL